MIGLGVMNLHCKDHCTDWIFWNILFIYLYWSCLAALPQDITHCVYINTSSRELLFKNFATSTFDHSCIYICVHVWLCSKIAAKQSDNTGVLRLLKVPVLKNSVLNRTKNKIKWPWMLVGDNNNLHKCCIMGCEGDEG